MVTTSRRVSQHTLVGYTLSTRNDKHIVLISPDTLNRSQRMLVIGAAHVDDIAVPVAPLVPKASNPVTWSHRVGGVATNAARAATHQLPQGSSVTLAAAVGDDSIARQLENTLRQCAIEPRLVAVHGAATGRYSAIMDAYGELYLGLADVSVAEKLTLGALQAVVDIADMDAVLIDANLSGDCLKPLADHAVAHNIPLAALSVSPAKTQRLLPLADAVTLLFCNRREALAMCPHLDLNDTLDHLADSLLQLGFKQFVLTDGQAPVITQYVDGRDTIAVPFVADPKNVNGAGDALAGATFAAWVHGQTLPDAVATRGLVEAVRVVCAEQTAPNID